NNSKFEHKVGSLPLTEGEKRGILQLGSAPRRFPWFRVICFLICAAPQLWIGWDGIAFTLSDSPPHTAEAISARSALATARQVGRFFVGILFLLLSITITMDWWIARGNASTVRKLVAIIPEGEQSGLLGTSS